MNRIFFFDIITFYIFMVEFVLNFIFRSLNFVLVSISIKIYLQIFYKLNEFWTLKQKGNNELEILKRLKQIYAQ